MNSYPPSDVLNGARTIRYFLRKLLDSQTAANIDSSLAQFLSNLQERDKVSEKILILLSKDKQTRRWMSQYLEQVAVNASKGFRDFSNTISPPDPPAAPEYACPKCGAPWFRRGKGLSIPKCVRCKTSCYELVIAHYICPEHDYIQPVFDEMTPIGKCPSHPNMLLVRAK